MPRATPTPLRLSALCGLALALGLGACSSGKAGASPSDDGGSAERAPLPPLVVTARSRLATGEAAVFDVHVPAARAPLRSLSARWGGHRAIVAPWDAVGRHFVVLTSIDIEEPARVLDLELTGADERGDPILTLRRFEIEEAAYDERHIRVAKKMVKPPKRAQRRAAREKAELAQVLENLDDERHWCGTFARPVTSKATSPFGTLRRYNRRKKQNRHLGWDLDGKTGDPIQATARGRVAMVQDRYYAGGTIILDHGGGLVSMYFHMSRFDVKVGDMVEQGQLIGAIGKTGRVTGPHLHFAFKLDGIYLSPKTLLAIDFSDDPLAKPAPVDRLASPPVVDRALGP